MTITPEQARARLERKPDASRIERRAYRTIAGMRPEYRAEFQTADGRWFPTPHHCSCSSGWGTKQQAARHAADWKADGYATRIVRRLVSKPEEIS